MIVLKLGGSLLNLRDLAARIDVVLAQRPREQAAIIVGGGAAADVVRAWDRVHSLGEEAAHRLALAAMRLTAEFVTRCLPRSRIVDHDGALAAAWSAGELPVLLADAWLDRAEAAGRTTVPHSWNATSDSIAALLATELAADELVLLKSVDRPHTDAMPAARDGHVDPCFPDAAARIPRLSWVNLRTRDCPITPWYQVRIA